MVQLALNSKPYKTTDEEYPEKRKWISFFQPRAKKSMWLPDRTQVEHQLNWSSFRLSDQRASNFQSSRTSPAELTLLKSQTESMKTFIIILSLSLYFLCYIEHPNFPSLHTIFFVSLCAWTFICNWRLEINKYSNNNMNTRRL